MGVSGSAGKGKAPRGGATKNSSKVNRGPIPVGMSMEHRIQSLQYADTDSEILVRRLNKR